MSMEVAEEVGDEVAVKTAPTKRVLEALSILNAELAGEEGSITVLDLWGDFARAKSTTLRAWKTEVGRSKHVLSYFGKLPAARLTAADVDEYRVARRVALTCRGGTTSPAQRNREVELLERILNFAANRHRIAYNPIARGEREPENNIRQVVVREPAMLQLLGVCDRLMRAYVLVAIDSGMRRSEVLRLRWDQIDTHLGLVDLGANDTKTREPRVTPLSDRAAAALEVLDRNKKCPYVFCNPKTMRPYSEYWMWERFRKAVAEADIRGPDGERVWYHDLRRTFTTLSRRRGVPESVIQSITGHRTRKTFERYNIRGVEDVLAAKEILRRAIARERKGPKRAARKKRELELAAALAPAPTVLEKAHAV